MAKTSHQRKAIIIGAGINGLVCAMLLQQQGFSVTIYEKTKALRNIGGGLFIYPHGIRVLQLLGLDSILQMLDKKIEQFAAYDHKGNILLQDNFNSFYQHTGNYVTAVSRTDLQMMLCAAFSGNIHLHHECTDVQQHADHVTATFKNGVKDSADILIGADGIHSVVRKHINQPDKPLTYRGICTWGGILFGQDCVDIPANSLTAIFSQSRYCTIGSMNHQRQMWFIIAHLKANDLIKGADKLSQLREVCAHWASPQINAILKAPQNDHNFATVVDEVSPETNWVEGHIALIGDAAHAFGPVQGQGVSTGLEDAFILTQCLKKYDSNIQHALQKYHTIRKPVVDQFRILENKQQYARVPENEKLLLEAYALLGSSSIAQLLAPVAQLVNPNMLQQQLDAI